MGGLKEIGVQRRSITNRRNCTTCPEGFTDLMHPSILFTVMQIYYALDLNAITLDKFHRVFHGLKHICLHGECSWTQQHISWAPSIADMQTLLLQLASTVRNWIHGSAANFLVSARSWQFHCFIESKTDRLRQFCGFAESRRGGGLMHYLHATPRSLIWPFCRLDGAHSAAGGLKMLLGGRTAGHWPLSGPQGAAATLSHRCKTADCKSAIRAQPAVCQWHFQCCQLLKSSGPCQSRNCHWAAQAILFPLQFPADDGTTTAELQYPLLHKPIY